MKSLLKIFTLNLLLLSTLAQAKTLEIDPNHSTLGFVATHLKISKIPGRFNEFSGTIDFNEKDFTKTKINLSINIASINTSVDKRDEHLKTPDFFDAQKYPTAKFQNTSITKKGKSFQVIGDLTIRDVTKKVTFMAENLGQIEDPMMKTMKNIFYAKGTINRRDFGVNYGTDAIVGDKVDIYINLETLPAAQ